MPIRFQERLRSGWRGGDGLPVEVAEFESGTGKLAGDRADSAFRQKPAERPAERVDLVVERGQVFERFVERHVGDGRLGGSTCPALDRFGQGIVRLPRGTQRDAGRVQFLAGRGNRRLLVGQGGAEFLGGFGMADGNSAVSAACALATASGMPTPLSIALVSSI